MSINELERKIAEMREMEKLAEEAREAAETIRDEIKALMLSRETEELNAGKFIIRWTSVVSNRLDTGALRKALPELAAQYTRPVTTRRFTVSG